MSDGKIDLNQIEQSFRVKTRDNINLQCILNGHKSPLQYDKHVKPIAQIAVICHPHPLFGGTMNNKVVSTLMRAYLSLNIPVVRFNFRGVGDSEGEHNYGVGEQDDLLAVLDFIQEQFESPQVWLSGFSFGSFVTAQVASQYDNKIQQLILVAPPVNMIIESSPAYEYPISFTGKFPILIVQGCDDEIVDTQQVKNYYRLLSERDMSREVEMIEMQETSHFFHLKLNLLRDHVIRSLTNVLIDI